LIYVQTSNEWAESYESWLYDIQYFEYQIIDLNNIFKLPYDVDIFLMECGESNASYYDDPHDNYNPEIVICYELISETNYRFTQYYEREYGYNWSTDEQIDDLDYSVLNVIENVFYHELGHAFLDVYDITYSGTQENVADQFSSYFSLEFLYDDDPENTIGLDVMQDAAWDYWLISEKYTDLPLTAFADTHSLDKQRFYNLACWTYGSYPNESQWMLNNGWILENRESWCEEEYNQLVKFWDEKFENNFQDGVMTSPVTTPQQQTQAPVVKEVTVINSVGSSTPGCEETNSCFIPSTATIPSGGTVTWENADNAAHTATSGTAGGGPSGHFDSSLIMAGGSFSHTFDQDGTYPYFCMVHPWMEGVVVVSSISAVPPTQQQTQQQTQLQTQQSKGGGCLIATAAFGSEMAPQVQFLREIRDSTVLQTESGSAFMTGFNQFYYSFSPTIADYERESPAFKEAVKITLTPLLASLTLLQYVDIDSESEMLGYGIGIILLNIGMYFVAPAVLIMKVRKRV
jgi:plastocyanin